jgi:hypothetical protein
MPAPLDGHQIETPHQEDLLANGDLSVWQRGVGPWTNNGNWTADEWMLAIAAPNTGTVDRVAGEKVGTYGLRLVRGGASPGSVYVETFLEVTKPLEGQWLTLSAWVKCATPNAARVLFGASPDGSTLLWSPNHFHSGGGAWELLHSTMQLPSTIAAFPGFNHGAGIYALVVLDAPTTLQLEGASLVIGRFMEGVAEPPQVPVAHRLHRCHRLYQKSAGNETRFNANVTSGIAYISGQVDYRVPMLATPTVTLTNVVTPTNFGAPVGTLLNSGPQGFREQRTASGTGGGHFTSSWTAEVA